MSSQGPIIPTKEEQKLVKILKERIPLILRIISDLANDNHERQEDNAETSRRILDELGL